MEPSKKRKIRLVVALSAAVLLATGLVYTSFSASTEAREPSEVLASGSQETYDLTGKVIPGSIERTDSEMTFNLSRKKKIPTLELRPCDANLPEYLAAGLVMVKAVSMGWLSGWKPPNLNNYKSHIKARQSAGRRGPRARLFWNNKPIAAADYLDRFFKTYSPFLEKMDIPTDVMDTIKLFKLGWNGAKIMRNACLRHARVHPRIWQRYFAEEYAEAVVALLNGESLYTFARMLGLRPPKTGRVRLGGRRW